MADQPTAYLDHKDLANTTILPERVAEIESGVRRVQDAVAAAETAAGRESGSVTLLAATKTRDVGEIVAAVRAGITAIGENRPQEVQIKAEVLQSELKAAGLAAPTMHLIGQLQSNKINKILPWVGTVESVDSLHLAEKIASRAAVHGQIMNVFLEVNESGEEAKSGCAPETALEEVLAIARLDGVRLTGLMTVGAHVDDETVIRTGFAHLRGLRDQVIASGKPGTADCTELSMGMTGDMALAIAEGATIVRVGTGIFGERAFV